MEVLRFAVCGAGFWARYQLAAWQELDGVACVAVCDPVRAKAEALARPFGVPSVYEDAETLLTNERPDFVDVISSLDSHPRLVHLAAAHKTPVICQKPLATTYAAAEEMVAACRAAGVPLYAHENWRWQTPIRELKRVLDGGKIGAPFRARITMASGFPVFVNQPYLKDLKQFIVADMGPHLLDTARFLFGEAETLYCQIHRVHTDIQGEDAATILLRMGGGTTVICEMAFAENYLERDRFPETYIFVEGARGSAEVAPDFWVRVTTEEGTHARRCVPPRYAWADPDYDIVHSSMVPCNANFLRALRGEGEAETTGEDNLKTLRLAFAAYDSAATGEAVRL